jgi:dipeptidyl aminopeptidase/acylaminoacyl peptidase
MLNMAPASAWLAMLAGAILSVTGSLAATPPEGSPPTLDDLLDARSIDGLIPSPDGRSIAFRVIEPDVTDNRLRARWYRVDIDGRSQAIPLGRPFQPILLPQFGASDDPVARWSPDSRNFYALAESRSEIQVHHLAPHGVDVIVTHSRGDVRSFSITPDGRMLRYQASAGRASIAKALADEQLRGIHLDESVITDGMRLTANYRIGNRLTTVRHLGDPVPAEAYSTPGMDGAVPLTMPRGGASTARITPPAADRVVNYSSLTTNQPLGNLPDGSAVAIVVDRSTTNPNVPTDSHVEARLNNGSTRICRERFCTGLYSAIREATLNLATNEVTILSDTDGTHQLELHAWNPRTGHSRLIWNGGGTLSTNAVRNSTACPVAMGQLICVFSSAVRPAELVAIDLTSGATRVLHDPNAGLAAKTYPVTRHLQWKTASGLIGQGVLVLPYMSAGPAPLVMTSYSCGGFLRGGTANVTPEFVLAQHGIASLCFDSINPGAEALVRAGTMAPLQMHKDDVARMTSIVEQLSGEGLVDRSKIGLSGQSYSSNLAAYAISQSDMLQAASLGTGVTIDPDSYFLTAPVASSWRRAGFPAMGLPRPTSDPDHIWDRVSPALNAAHIHAALLMQPPESEYSFALQLYGSIQDAGGKVDMFIFPDAGHMMESEPAQQRSRALRSLGWFRYWLNGERPEDVSAEELAHWDQLRRGQQASASAGH